VRRQSEAATALWMSDELQFVDPDEEDTLVLFKEARS
jgi:hypothetical protein